MKQEADIYTLDFFEQELNLLGLITSLTL